MNATISTIPADNLYGRLGRNGEQWIKGHWTGPASNGKPGMCLHQAIHLCSPRPGDAHLIGDMLSQADYDNMTHTWRTIIGPIHPDDKPVTT